MWKYLQDRLPVIKRHVNDEAQMEAIEDNDLKDTAQDPATYLDHAHPSETRQLLSMFIKSIDLNSDTMEITYKKPLPDRETRQEITSDLVPI